MFDENKTEDRLAKAESTSSRQITKYKQQISRSVNIERDYFSDRIIICFEDRNILNILRKGTLDFVRTVLAFSCEIPAFNI